MDFTFYLDESGDHGLNNIDPGFPVFVLCGVLFHEPGYNQFCEDLNSLKTHFFGCTEIVFHSREIRKCEKEFWILKDAVRKTDFYERLNSIVRESSFRVIAAVIDKKQYIERYAQTAKNPYEISLSFILERLVLMLGQFKSAANRIRIVVEKRGKKEDRELELHFEELRRKGTYYVSADKIAICEIEFRNKKANINGLQLSDLIAYPIGRKCIDPTGSNLAFEIFQDKIYQKNGRLFGLKFFP